MDNQWLVGFAKQFNIIALLTYLIPLGVGLLRWRTLQAVYRPLFWFALGPGCLLNGVLAEYGRHVLHNNIVFLQMATLGETLCLTWAYYYAFNSGRARTVLLVAGGLFLGFYLFEVFYINGGSLGHNTYVHVVQSILLIGAAVAYFEQILRELRNIDLSEDPIFMVSVGSILYYAGTVMVFVLESKLQDQPDLIWIMYIVQFILLIVFNIFLAIALWNGEQQAQYCEIPPKWPSLQ